VAGTAARSGGVYRKGIIREGRLVGVILLGVRRGEDGYRRTIEEGIDVEPLRRRLLDPEGDPLPDARGAPDSSVVFQKCLEHRGRRCARLARREEGEYREYLTDEQRSETGCSDGRMPRDF